MRPLVFQVGGTLYWVLQTRNPDTMVLKDADSTPSVAVRKNGASVGDSVTVTKRAATTGIYDCSYNPASEVEGDSFTLEESATVTGTTTAQATYAQTWNARVVAVERGTDSAALASGVNVTQIGGDTQSATDLKDFADAGYDPSTHKVQHVVLVDTTTTLTNLPTIPTVNEIADGVWEEPTAGHTTAGTYGGRVVRSTNSNVEVLITGSNHIAADVHEFQTGVIVAGAFAADAITAAALAADAVTEIQAGLATSAAVAAEAVKTANILDGVAWILADATGAIAAPQSATATAILTTFGATYTVQYAGLTSTGVRTAPTLTKV